jgi:5'-nucleotidase
MEAQPPLILVSNDDGIHAPGIRALAEALAQVGEVSVVAPDRERSATGHAITLDRPLRIEEVDEGFYSVTGTPCDAVYVALHHVLPRRPALVVSGVNRGYNLGEDVFYSGTVAAAVEGALRGVPAIAVSLGPRERREQAHHEPADPSLKSTVRVSGSQVRRKKSDEYQAAAQFASALAARVLANGLPGRTLLNVNVPPGEPTGFEITRFGRRNYNDAVVGRDDPRGRSYFWIGGPEVGYEDIPGSDCNAVRLHRISVTPMSLDVTAYPFTSELLGWELEGFGGSLEGALAAAAAGLPEATGS